MTDFKPERFRLGVTGTRDGCTEEQLYVLKEMFKNSLNNQTEVSLIHGDCVGADAQADAIAKSLGIECFLRPCNIKALRAFCEGTILAEPEDPLDRNKKIVEDSDFLIVLPKEVEEQQRSGTWSTWRFAKKTGVQWIIIQPNGKVRYEWDGKEYCDQYGE
jgi:hypothetical protein